MLGCVLAVLSHIDWGNFEATKASVGTSFSISVNCPSGAPYAVTLDAGSNANASGRHVVKDASRIYYVTYRPDGQQWGDATFDNTFAEGLPIKGTGTGAAQVYSGMALLHPNSPFSSPTVFGVHTDTVVVTLHY